MQYAYYFMKPQIGSNSLYPALSTLSQINGSLIVPSDFEIKLKPMHGRLALDRDWVSANDTARCTNNNVGLMMRPFQINCGHWVNYLAVNFRHRLQGWIPGQKQLCCWRNISNRMLDETLHAASRFQNVEGSNILHFHAFQTGGVGCMYTMIKNNGHENKWSFKINSTNHSKAKY